MLCTVTSRQENSASVMPFVSTAPIPPVQSSVWHHTHTHQCDLHATACCTHPIICSWSRRWKYTVNELHHERARAFSAINHSVKPTAGESSFREGTHLLKKVWNLTFVDDSVAFGHFGDVHVWCHAKVTGALWTIAQGQNKPQAHKNI